LPSSLELLAIVAVKVGLCLQIDQELVVTAPLEAAPLVRLITRHAYKSGASLVTTIFDDEQATVERFRWAPENSFDHAAAWLYEGLAAAFRSGAARLAIKGEDPRLLSSQSPEKIARLNAAKSQASKPALELISSSVVNWTVIPFATRGWAAAVFPNETDED